MDSTKILTRQEVKAVIADLQRSVYYAPPSRRSPNKFIDLIIFRLSCCCGLRVKEIVGLNLGDMIATGIDPWLRISRQITKGREGQRKSRIIHLNWDAGTLQDLRIWRDMRLANGASKADPFVCSLWGDKVGQRLTRQSAQRRWRSALRVLEPERRRFLTIHCGRHSFISHSLYIGRSIVEVKEAAGHGSITTTSIYAHLLERSNVPDIFDFSNEEPDHV